jgi:hypothetical protein
MAGDLSICTCGRRRWVCLAWGCGDFATNFSESLRELLLETSFCGLPDGWDREVTTVPMGGTQGRGSDGGGDCGGGYAGGGPGVGVFTRTVTPGMGTPF